MSWGQSLQYPYPPIWWGILCMKCCTTRFNSFWWWPLLKFLYPPIWWDELYKLNCCTVCGCIENFGGGGTQLCWPMWGEKSCQCLLRLCHGCFFFSSLSLGLSCVWSIFEHDLQLELEFLMKQISLKCLSILPHQISQAQGKMTYALLLSNVCICCDERIKMSHWITWHDWTSYFVVANGVDNCLAPWPKQMQCRWMSHLVIL